ncbi:unnamed protein product, partial [Rotaria magnacalcarata]
MTKAIIIFLLISIKCNHLHGLFTLFDCTFDNGLVDDCNFTGVFTIADTLEIDEGYTLTNYNFTSPDRPLSDASSVFSPTNNGEMCLFPYELNGWDMHFCLFEENANDSTCPTKSGNQTCARGQYGYKTTADPASSIDAYRSVQTIIINSADEENCLSFYYYFTNSLREPNITIIMSGQSNISNVRNIVTVKANDENRWYYSQTTFILPADAYRLMLTFRRADDFTDTTNFTFALDNISITTGSCFYATNDSATTDVLTFNETVTTPTVSGTHTTERNATTQMIESTTTSLESLTAMSILPTSTTTKISNITIPLTTTLAALSTTTDSIKTTNNIIINTTASTPTTNNPTNSPTRTISQMTNFSTTRSIATTSTTRSIVTTSTTRSIVTTSTTRSIVTTSTTHSIATTSTTSSSRST